MEIDIMELLPKPRLYCVRTVHLEKGYDFIDNVEDKYIWCPKEVLQDLVTDERQMEGNERPYIVKRALDVKENRWLSSEEIWAQADNGKGGN